MKKIRGLATGIGSLPHKDTNEALDLIFRYVPHIPFWPQLHKRNMREGMIIQYSQNLPCLRINQKGLFFDSSVQEQELAKFYEHIIADDVEYFGISSDYAAGLWAFINRLEKENINNIEFIKGQVAGPFTFSASINDSEGKAILHNSVFVQAMREGLAMKARWQIGLFSKFGKPMVIFFDEPYLACFGSAYTPINRSEVVAGLTEFTAKIKFPKVLIGVHCCGNTDWSIFTEVPGIDIISFDAFNFWDRILLYSESLSGFFKKGGILAWGIVPTEDFTTDINTDFLLKKIKYALASLVKKGLDEYLLKNRLILTPSCGLGTLDSKKSQAIFKCLAEVSSAFS